MKRYLIAISIILAVGAAAYSFEGFGLLALIRGAATPERVPVAADHTSGKTMRAFASKAELIAAMKAARNESGRRKSSGADSSSNASTMDAAAPAASTGVTVTSESKSENITNNQSAGVDEGGIVKNHGDHLVILRRGRLFTVKVGGRSLEPVSSVDAYAPGVDPSGDWYDEMLISGNTVVVIGYSYDRGGTEINLFDINSRGGLSYRSSYHLKSNDYYSSRNYASRLIGNKLVFYTPQYIGQGEDPESEFPAIRRWRRNAKDSEFRPVVGATQIYRAERPASESTLSALHTVTVCDLASQQMPCKGTGVIGDPGRVFYVSPKNVYVWTNEWSSRGATVPNTMLYKMPLDGSAPSAVGAAGAPVDQFSFFEDETERLDVLIRSDAKGEQMWGSEAAAGDIALFSIDAFGFGDGASNASRENYQDLPNVPGYTFQNRFVGDNLLYGTGNGWGHPDGRGQSDLIVVDRKSRRVSELRLDHTVDRIEPMGRSAVVVGTKEADLFFTPVELDGTPNVRRSFIRENASQGELRSHGFFYKPEGNDSGTLGLPIARQGRPGYKHLTEGSAAILFIRNDDLELKPVGELEARDAAMRDGCRASCVDWYGNARPIFLKGRIFALLGYELVEGRLDRSRVREMRRINYSPKISTFSGDAQE